MRNIFNVFEKFLLILLFFSFSFLIIVQFTEYNDISNNIMIFNKNNLSYLNNNITSDKGIITLKSLNGINENVKVLLNGEYACDFSKNNVVEIYVYNNDIIEIDSTECNFNMDIYIIKISNNIINPKIDTILATSNNIEILGKVQLK